MCFKETELAWAAGFFDGEGCIHVAVVRKLRGVLRKTPGFYWSLKLSQLDKRPLVRFQQAVGVEGRLTQSKTPKGKANWRLSYNGKEPVHSILKQLWPYLGEPKKEQYRRERKRFVDKDVSYRRALHVF